MNVSTTLFRFPASASLAAIAMAFVLAGCGASNNSQDGDKDAKLGIYRVSLSRIDLQFSLEPAVAAYSREVQVSASCEGQDLPPDCGSNPGWKALQPTGSDFIEVTFADRTQPKTSAKVTINTAKYYATYGDNIDSFDSHWFLVGIVPSSIPEKMTLFRDHLNIKIFAAQDLDQRQEQTPGDPRLTAIPAKVFISDLPASGTLIYSGPETTIGDIIYGGAGKGMFSLSAPAVSTPLRAGTHRLSYTIEFTAPRDDKTQYGAAITIATLNGATCTITVTGQHL